MKRMITLSMPHRLMETRSEAPGSGGSPRKRLLITVSILSCWIQLTSAQKDSFSVVPNPPYGTVGSSIILNIQGFSGKSLSYTWYRKSNDSHNQIAFYTVDTGVQEPTKIWQKILPSGSLLIPYLTLNDTDDYIVQIIDSTSRKIVATRGHLAVYEEVVKPIIALKGRNMIENDSLVLICSTENKGLIILWIFNNQPLSLNERMNMSENNQTLTIKSVKREDTGTYQCETWNPINAKRSDPLNLTVNYGPDHIKILPSPENEKIEIKFNDPLILKCQALSNPSAQYEWHFNDNIESKTSKNIYNITSASWEHSGKYTCLARNIMTNFSVFRDITVKVVDKSPVCTRYIIGTAIGVLAGVAFIETLIYLFFVRKTRRASIRNLSEKNHSTPKHGEDTTQNDTSAWLKDSALPKQGLGFSSTSPEIPSESIYQTLEITTVDIYDKIWKNSPA